MNIDINVVNKYPYSNCFTRIMPPDIIAQPITDLTHANKSILIVKYFLAAM